MDMKLILIEGLPGSGKSTTAEYLAGELQRRGIHSRWFHEMDDDNPIADLPCDVPDYQARMVEEWSRFVEQAQNNDSVTVLESRFWQNTALFMYMGTYSVEEVTLFNDAVASVIQPLSPVLFYMAQKDVEAALRRLDTFRGKDWMEAAIEVTTKERWFQSRGLGGFDGWVKFFSEWTTVADRLYDRLEFRKHRIHDPHQDWKQAYADMRSFLGLHSSYA
jgi:deoxyadenosine/deoxycytidine kinase